MSLLGRFARRVKEFGYNARYGARAAPQGEGRAGRASSVQFDTQVPPNARAYQHWRAVCAVVDAPESRVLHRFRHADDIAQWTTTSDKIVGGAQPLRRLLALSPACVLTGLCAREAGFSECSFEQNGKVGLFTGNISLKTSGDMLRSGFCTVRTLPYERVGCAEKKPKRPRSSRTDAALYAQIPDLEPFSALELRLRTDGRPYFLNIKCANMSEAIFQGKMVLPPHKWFTVALPFSSFLLTHRGRIVEVQQEIDKADIDGFGVLIADGVAGPFRFEIDYIKAIRDFDADEYARVPEGRHARGTPVVGDGAADGEAGGLIEEAVGEAEGADELEERKKAAMVK